MKPITEHPDFLEEKYKWRRWCRQNEETHSNSFNQGGKAAQSILSEEHDREMEEFARWIIKKADTLEFLPLSGGKWAQVPENSKYDISFNEVLSIFRKEHENG